MREDSNNTQRVVGTSFYEWLVRWATERPNASSVIEAETSQSLTYDQTLAAVNTMRQFLGEVPRSLAIALSGGVVSAIMWISALSGGHRLVPLVPNASDEEKKSIAQRNGVDVLVVERAEDAQGFAVPHATVLTQQVCDLLIRQATFQAPMPPREGSVCLTTSGTTGERKGIILHERQIVWTAEHVRLSHQITPEDRCLTVLPFHHVNVSIVSLCSSLLAGSAVIIAQRFRPQPFWSWIERYQVTWASLAPTSIAMLLKTEHCPFLPGSLRFVRTGSASLPAADVRTFEARFGIPVVETYDVAEAAGQVATNPVPPGSRKPGSVGHPVGVSLRICIPGSDGHSEMLCDVKRGKTGEICIAGPGVIEAYQNSSGTEAFQDGWFRTGDLGYLDQNGYLFLKGRLREVINAGRQNVTLCESEERGQSEMESLRRQYHGEFG